MKLTKTLDTLPDDMLLSSGRLTQSVECLRDQIHLADTAEDETEAEYVTGTTSDGLTIIQMLDAYGYRIIAAAYIEQRA